MSGRGNEREGTGETAYWALAVPLPGPERRLHDVAALLAQVLGGGQVTHFDHHSHRRGRD